MKIIPAIDIIDSKVVRLTEGQYDKIKIYSDSVLDMAIQYEELGFKYLHLVDLDAAKAKSLVNFKIIEEVASQTSLKLDYGGGITNLTDLERLFNAGIDNLNIGSMALIDPDKVCSWMKAFGNDRFILSADCLNRNISINAWQDSTGMDIMTFLKFWYDKGLSCATVTDIACDGKLQGPSLSLFRDIISQTNIELIASGGIGSNKDVDDLKTIGCHGVIIGKALLEGKINISNLLDDA